MSSSADECIKSLNTIVEDCEIYDFATRDSDLQKEACETLHGMLARCANLKAQAITQQDEEFANTLLGFECVAYSLLGSLSMWIKLKEQRPDEAWDHLISAQSAAIYAAKADRHFSHLEKRVKDLENIEELIFPPQVFVSAGLIVRRQECSICQCEYGECNHLAGRPYWGEFCSIVAKDFEGNHVALVKAPADKRCRIMQFTVETGERNRMTWKIDPSDPSNPEANTSENGLRTRANLIYANKY